MTDTNQLDTDPSRDASDSIRGYVYQILQSALAWMQLGEGELLVLEGAEDFDVYEAESVTTVQVKDLSQRLTLRSKSVIEGLNNYWTCRSQNPDFKVKYRFLSTASAGMERGSPFGKNKKGLDYWAQVSRGVAELQLLRDFLLQLKLTNNLNKFIAESSDEDFKGQLISRIKWDLGKKPLQGLQLALEEKLKCHGFTTGVNAIEACRVLPHVVKYVGELLCGTKPRELRFGDFLTCFDDATTISVRRTNKTGVELQKLLSDPGNTDIARVFSAAPVLGELGPVVAGGINRSNVIADLVLRLAEQRVIFLTGSSGTGKTNLAILLANEVGGSWCSINLRNRSIVDIRDILRRAIFELQSGQIHPLLLIDDIDLKQVSQVEREIISLIFLVTDADGMVIATGPTRPPLHLLPKLWKDEACHVEAPYFDSREISALIRAHGLVNEDRVDQWSKIVSMNTLGHPQLVHARVRNLSAAEWPAISLDDLTQPKDIERVRSEARIRLIEEIPNDNARVLAYRLSLVSGSFSREMAIAVAIAPPQLPLPGEVFDILVGPWIERQQDNKYRVSPLLVGAANKVLAPTDTQAIHCAIAESVMVKKCVDQFEIGTALFHAYAGKHDVAAIQLAYSIITMDRKLLSYLYDAASWFTLIALGENQRLFPENPSIDVMLRLVQYKLVTAAPTSEKVSVIIARIEESLVDVEPEELKIYSEALAYGTILNTIEVAIPSKDVVRLVSKLMDFSKNHDFFRELSERMQDTALKLPQIGDNKPAQVLFSFQAGRLSGIDDFSDLVDALDQLPDEKREELLAVCKSDFEFSSVLVGRAWWKSVDAGTLDARRAIAIFRASLAKFRDWKVPSLIKASLIAIAVLEDEYLKEPECALATVDEAEREFPNDGEVQNQRAKIYFGMKATRKVIPFVNRALASNDLSNVERTFCCRLGGMSAAQHDDWEEAQRFFNLGAKNASMADIQNAMGVGLIADAAFALWKQEKYKDSLLAFASCLEKLSTIDLTDDIRTRYLHATVRHAISWIHFAARGMFEAEIGGVVDPELTEPRPGMCSSQEPSDEILDHKVFDIGTAWQLLALTESALELDAGIESRIPKLDSSGSSLLFGRYQRTFAFDMVFKKRQFDQLVPRLISMLEALPSMAGRKSEEVDFDRPDEIPPLPDNFWDNSANLDWIFVYVLSASIVCTANDSKADLPLRRWRGDLTAANALSQGADEFLLVLDGKSPDESLFQTAAASVFLLRGGTLAPETLFRLSFRLLNALSLERQKAGVALEKLLVERWRFSSHHQKFAFSLPSKTCPEIESCCNDKSIRGLKKVACILKIAAPSLKIRLDHSAEKMLEDFSSVD